jgi:hypothetical protein
MILTVYFKQDIYHSNLGSDDWTKITHDYLITSNLGWFSQIRISNSNSFDYFSFLTLTAIICKVLFHLQGSDTLIYNFLFWQQLFTFAVLLACATVGLFYRQIKKNNRWFIAIVPLLNLIIAIVMTMFYSSPFTGKMWVCIFTIYYCYLIFAHKYISISSRNIFLSLIMVNLIAFNGSLIIVSGILLIFTFFYDCAKRNNPLSTLVYLGVSFLFTLFIWLDFSIWGLQIFFITTTLIVYAILTFSYQIWCDNRVIAKINNFFYTYFFVTLSMSLVAVLLSAVFCTITVFGYKLDFNVWEYDGIWNIPISNSGDTTYIVNIFNASWWCLFLFIFLVMLVYNIKKHNNVSNLSYTMLPLFALCFFVNPLTINLWSSIMKYGYQFDLSILNYIIIIHMLVSATNILSKHKAFMAVKGIDHEPNLR